LRCTFEAILAVDIAREVTHVVLCIVQEATSTLDGHSYFVLTLIVPVTVERMSECLSILVTEWALLQRIVTHPVREEQRVPIICTVKARDTLRCYMRTVHFIIAFQFMVAFGGAGDARNVPRSWSTSGGTINSRNTARGRCTEFEGTFGWAINSWNTLSGSCSSWTGDTRDAF
jgi:hypothetical protein